MNGRHDDPFAKPHMPYTDALDRIAEAVHWEKRRGAGTAVDFHEPLDDEQAGLLREMFEFLERDGDSSPYGIFLLHGRMAISPKMKTDGAFDRLAAKGCVEIGRFLVGALWSSAPNRPEWSADQSAFLVRTTPRGREMLSAYDKEKSEGGATRK